MATQPTTSLKGRTVRLTRLDACGVPVTGPASSLVTEGFVTVEMTPEIETGEEYTLKNAWGEFCVSEKDSDRWKWVNVAMSFCEVNPDILDIVGGADVITDGTDNIGAAFGEDQLNDGGFAIEVWTKQAGRNCSGGNPQWGYFIVPFCVNGALDGSFLIENGTLTCDMKGEGQLSVADWGVNPYGDNPLLTVAGMPVDKYMAQVLTTVQPPAATDGAVALS